MRLFCRPRRSSRERWWHDRPPVPLPHPVYIYPGVIRMSARRAVALDAACPAALYVQLGEDSHGCAVCLDSFTDAKDIIRELSCGHLFHSRCILSWVSTADRCPLCNEPIVAREEGIWERSGDRSREAGEGSAKRSGSNQVSVPDVTPSTLCQLQRGPRHGVSYAQPADHAKKVEEGPKHVRVYSFVQHDQSRFAHLLDKF